jgi:hypothetical protein
MARWLSAVMVPPLLVMPRLVSIIVPIPVFFVNGVVATFAVQAAINTVTLTIQSVCNGVAFFIQVVSQSLLVLSGCAIWSLVQMIINMFTPGVKTVINQITAPIQSVFDNIVAPVCVAFWSICVVGYHSLAEKDHSGQAPEGFFMHHYLLIKRLEGINNARGDTRFTNR